jgi:hypothetical protein
MFSTPDKEQTPRSHHLLLIKPIMLWASERGLNGVNTTGLEDQNKERLS